MWMTPKAGTCGMTARMSGRPLEMSTHLPAQVHVAARGMWPTPTSTAGDGRSEQSVEVWQTRQERTKREKGINNGLPLNVAVRLWPTPRANEAKQHNSQDNGVALSRAVAMWPTPQAFDATDLQRSPAARARALGKGGCRNLREWVPMWATPSACDAMGTTGGGQHRSLRTDVGGQLNPEFVEILMGLPPGWTALEEEK
jgi:hypothetical protein